MSCCPTIAESRRLSEHLDSVSEELERSEWVAQLAVDLGSHGVDFELWDGRVLPHRLRFPSSHESIILIMKGREAFELDLSDSMQ